MTKDARSEARGCYLGQFFQRTRPPRGRLLAHLSPERDFLAHVLGECEPRSDVVEARMPCRPSSTATALVGRSSPAFAAAYMNEASISTFTEEMDDTFTERPAVSDHDRNHELRHEQDTAQVDRRRLLGAVDCEDLGGSHTVVPGHVQHRVSAGTRFGTVSTCHHVNIVRDVAAHRKELCPTSATMSFSARR